MRSRWAILAAVLLVTFITAAPVLAAPRHSVAQADQSDSETPKAEPGSEKDAAEPAVKEKGPPWTFQMARIIVVLSIFLLLAIFRWYWKLVGSRAKGTA